MKIEEVKLREGEDFIRLDSLLKRGGGTGGMGKSRHSGRKSQSKRRNLHYAWQKNAVPADSAEYLDTIFKVC